MKPDASAMQRDEVERGTMQPARQDNLITRHQTRSLADAD